jgi:hypothetical protein
VGGVLAIRIKADHDFADRMAIEVDLTRDGDQSGWQSRQTHGRGQRDRRQDGTDAQHPAK